MDIKEIATRLVHDYWKRDQWNMEYFDSVGFAEALIAELAKGSYEWRIKPDEPKKVKFFGWLGTSGELRQIRANESWPNHMA